MARKAYGAHRTMTPATQARNIANSILLHRARDIDRTLADYGDVPADVATMVQELTGERDILVKWFGRLIAD